MSDTQYSPSPPPDESEMNQEEMRPLSSVEFLPPPCNSDINHEELREFLEEPLKFITFLKPVPIQGCSQRNRRQRQRIIENAALEVLQRYPPGLITTSREYALDQIDFSSSGVCRGESGNQISTQDTACVPLTSNIHPDGYLSTIIARLNFVVEQTLGGARARGLHMTPTELQNACSQQIHDNDVWSDEEPFKIQHLDLTGSD
ncbi:hypothetical protein TREMEDRAFT_61054 [Tremella mesenterica DSM 1558]|uniref:uncharacterized protein n=1 Tax=Tremella mesenterica (strain ATCC 24925 / CBS 8224 / DSM 1558 / NBRC 9311 / NRRL Y-6157 / RJB 2259-6 / UBC 559-6) TaxID=578456 RepID=UPI0003F48D17|nr:uncharacterized protein TREMEDRAFT_61054 [Tremella mesenterica DSM 1558]EIW70546.1 hypothetical protein TREMEDRAFT_61054 [Tremella mesenterica DSM 1558]